MIAIAGPNLPLELLEATGRFAGAVPFDPERETPVASQWVENKFLPWAHPVIEAWAAGEYDHLDQVLFSRADDTSQRLYYYACELQRRGLIAGPEPMILDIAKIPRDLSRDRTIMKLRELGEKLGVSEDALEAEIVKTNAARAEPAEADDRPVCVLSGTAAPDHRLRDAIAGAGFATVGQTVIEEWLSLGEAIEEGTGDPYAALGRKLHRAPSSRSMADRGELLTKAIADTGASAVILWRVEEDEDQGWHLPVERAAIDAAGIPGLVLTRRDWLARDGAIDEITAFLKEARA